MTAVLKQSSNNTGLFLAEEVLPSVVNNLVSWVPQEPNSYKDFGGQFKTIARKPINPSRQNRKGVVVDLDASGGWQEDVTLPGVQNKIQGLMFADFRRKAETLTTAAVASTDAYTVPVGTPFKAGDLVAASGFLTPANNGLKHVVASDATHVSVQEALADETTVSGALVKIGHTFASGDVTFTASTRKLTSAAVDLTTFGLIVGEWLFLASDDAANTLAANVGYARIYSIGVGSITFDKMQLIDPTSPAVDDLGTGKKVSIFFGRVIKNELGPLIKHRTYQAERTLGRDDTTAPGDQAEYIKGAVINEAVFTLNTADKATCEWTLVAAGYETRSSLVGVKAGSRPAVVSGSAYNTSTDVKRLAVELCGTDVPLYAYVLDASITINNNAKPNKAIGVLGAIDITEGQFSVSATANAYFSTVAAAQAIENNNNVTFDVILARENQGMVIDLPLISLGDGRNKVTANEVIQLPLSIDAATAASINPNADYTAMFVFFDYLPNSAM